MELFRTTEFYIFINGEYSLWWDRYTGAFIPKTGWDLTDADDPICLGLLDGIIGKIEHSTVFDSRLLLIKESLPVGELHGEQVYKIKSIVFLQLGSDNIELNLQQCPKHKKINLQQKLTTNPAFFDNIQKNVALTKTWGTIKNAGNTIKNTTQHAAAAIATGNVNKRRDSKDKERFERQIIDEFIKIFTDTNSFYYSKHTDITNSLQRLCLLEKSNGINPKAFWKTADDRFFWNKYMLKDLIDLNNPLADPWIMPIIQGYIQIEDCKVDLDKDLQTIDKKFEIFKLCILSRRSRFRAGTRYKRRGVNENGECANYVETEQLIRYQSHEVSFVQVRGSVPVYWSQPGYKYRPPPRIDRGEAETMIAFERHFTQEIQKYGPICAVNLIDQSGKEKVIFDAYSNYMLKYDSPFITYVTFDFHEYCRGMHFENVSIVINALTDIIKDMNYCWRDKQGHICSQNGLFRVNCIDCLDRTNVVQTAIGKAVMEIQFCKLGLITPEVCMPSTIKNTFQLLWANNGDIISKQYAGTNALKGDYTRTGERKFTGIMKDGMNSANRYYQTHFRDNIRQCCLDLMLGCNLETIELQDIWNNLFTLMLITNENLPKKIPYTPHLALEQEYALANVLYHTFRYYLSRFKDSTRQGTIDLMLGNYVSEELFNESKIHHDEEDSVATAEHVKLLIEDCKKMLINQPEYVLGAWGLINANPTTEDPTETDMDSILILTKDSYYVADYDDHFDKITKYQKIPLKDINLIECGLPEISTNLFRTNNKCKYCLRINYKVNGICGYYHMFRSSYLRFFNNMAVIIKSDEEEIESLKAICEAFVVAIEIVDLPPIPYNWGKSLERRKSKVSEASNIYLGVEFPQITRNVSESQLLSLKNVGTKALSNVTQQFSKIGNSFKINKKPNFRIGIESRNDSSSEDDDVYENSIFQPDKNDECSSSTTVDLDTIKSHKFLPSVGIVMGSQPQEINELTLENKENLLNCQTTLNKVNNLQIETIMKMPEIQINSQTQLQQQLQQEQQQQQQQQQQQSETSLKLDNKLSHSSGEVDDEPSNNSYYYYNSNNNHHQIQQHQQRSNSVFDLPLNISQSQSESAIKNRLITNLTSPVANATKDLVFTPFTKLAKGVQNLSANFDPRKLTQIKQISEKDLEEHRKLIEKWQNSKTKLIAL